MDLRFARPFCMQLGYQLEARRKSIDIGRGSGVCRLSGSDSLAGQVFIAQLSAARTDGWIASCWPPSSLILPDWAWRASLPSVG